MYLWLEKGTTRLVLEKFCGLTENSTWGENQFIFDIQEGTMFQRPANNHLSAQQKGAIIAQSSAKCTCRLNRA